MKLLKSFESKRIFVTGHTGFKGSWLFKSLSMAGAEVLGYSLPPEDLSHFNQIGLNKLRGAESFGDVRDFGALRKVLKDFEPEVIFHLAAQPLVSRSFENPRETFETNFMGGINLLDACRDLKRLACIVFITSDKAYENMEWKHAYRENDRLGGADPYSASKGAVELAVSSYQRSFFASEGVELLSARAGNVIGGGDWSKDRIVPDVIRAVASGKKVELRNPLSTRPWQHVLEPISGYLTLALASLERASLEGAYNFGPSYVGAHSVQNLVEVLLSELNHSEVRISHNATRLTHEANLLQLSCDLAKVDLGWSAKWDFEVTAMQTARWYKTWLDGGNLEETSECQIEEYFDEQAD